MQNTNLFKNILSAPEIQTRPNLMWLYWRDALGKFFSFQIVFYSIPFVHSRHQTLVSRGYPWYELLFAAIDKMCIRHAVGVVCHGPYLR